MSRGVIVAGIIAIAAGACLCSLGQVWADPAAAPVDYTKITTIDLVKNTPQGKLTNPYKDTQEDIVAAVEAAVAETGATTAKQMGVVMKSAQAKLAGKTIDGKLLSEKVKAKLS